MVIFAIFVGFAYLRVARKQPESGSLLKRGIDAIYALVMSIVTFVLRLTPYGIIAIMASTIATSDFQAIWTLGKFMIASYAINHNVHYPFNIISSNGNQSSALR